MGRWNRGGGAIDRFANNVVRVLVMVEQFQRDFFLKFFLRNKRTCFRLIRVRAIQLYLGHKNIQHTIRYTELAAGRFYDFWTD